jgi:NADH dehydrogenase
MTPTLFQSTRRRLVVLGGGFAGLHFLRRLCAQVRDEDALDIFWVSERNHFVFTPMLTEVVAGAISPQHIAHPLRTLVTGRHRPRVLTARVTHVNLDQQELTLTPVPGGVEPDETASHTDAPHASSAMMDEPWTLSYDMLVVSVGSAVNKALVPGAQRYAFGLKDISEAMAIRTQVLHQLDRALLVSDDTQRQAMLRFVVAGGGFSGVEVAGALRDILKHADPYYPAEVLRQAEVVLVEGQPKLLPELHPALGRDAQRILEQRGVRLRLGMLLTQIERYGVWFKDGSFLPAHTVVWTTGVAMPALIKSLSCSKDRGGRVLVSPTLAVPEYPNVWVLGDCAAIATGAETWAPPTAQFAVQEAAVGARNVLAALRSRSKMQAFEYTAKGEMAVLGDGQGIGVVGQRAFNGRLGWLLWRGFYWSRLPSLANKLGVLLDWLLKPLFPPDMSVLQPPEQTPLGQPETAPTTHALAPLAAKRDEAPRQGVQV